MTKITETNRWLALGAVAGPILFTFAWVVLGVFQPATRNMYGVMGGISGAISNPISGLGVGPNAAAFNLAFLICGLTTLAGVIGIFLSSDVKRQPVKCFLCAMLLGLSPLGLSMAGVYTLASSLSLHFVAAALLFLSPVVSFLIAGSYFRGMPEWRKFGTLLTIASPITAGLIICYAISFNQAAVANGQGIAGLTERLLIIWVQLWYVIMGWKVFVLQRQRLKLKYAI